jgi:predicted GIY-YIG superfamily endonuclease
VPFEALAKKGCLPLHHKAALARARGALRRASPDSAKQGALRSLGEEGLFATSPQDNLGKSESATQDVHEPNRDASMRYVYLLESIEHPDQHDIGLSDDLRTRLAAHNAGQSAHTAKFKPWRLVTCLAFTDPEKAKALERYLKSGSGHAFARKRLW